MAAPPLLLLFGTLLVPSAARPPATNASAAPSPTVVTVGVLLPEDLRYPWAWPRVAPALSLALEALQPELRLAGLAVRTVFVSAEVNGTCDDPVVELKAAELKSTHDPDVLLGLRCHGGYSQYADWPFSKFWQLPFLKAGDYLRPPRRITESRMEVYAGPLGLNFRAFQVRLHQDFNWTSNLLLVDIGERAYGRVFPFLFCAENDLTNLRYAPPGEAIRFIQEDGPVVYIFGSLEALQEIMHLAQAKNMTNGDRVFFYVDIFGESLRPEGHSEAAKPWQSKGYKDTGNLREAFQTVLVITPHEPRTPEYRHFLSQLILRAQRDFGVDINDSKGHLVAGCFHDGLLLYLRALNETLREGGTKRDASHILEKMRGQKFQGVTGTVTIDSKNDRVMDFDLWAMRDVECGEFQVVAHYIGSEERIKWLGPILWKTGRPPLDNLSCVFNLDGCTSGKSGCVRD